METGPAISFCKDGKRQLRTCPLVALVVVFSPVRKCLPVWRGEEAQLFQSGALGRKGYWGSSVTLPTLVLGALSQQGRLCQHWFSENRAQNVPGPCPAPCTLRAPECHRRQHSPTLQIGELGHRTVGQRSGSSSPGLSDSKAPPSNLVASAGKNLLPLRGS